MVNDILSAISMKLSEVFGEGYEIYTQDIEQGLQEPCFFLAILKPERRQMLGTRSYQTNPFDIHYFHTDNTDNNGMIAVGEQLMDALEMIEDENGDFYRGTERSYEIVDGVLHFFVNYNAFLNQTANLDTMETVEIAAGTKEG